jgi:hypothetical protein
LGNDFAVFEKTEIANSELYCSSCSCDSTIVYDHTGFGEFTNSEKEIEGDEHQTNCCLSDWIFANLSCLVAGIWHYYWHCQLRCSWWIQSSETFNHSLNAHFVLAFFPVYQTWFSSHQLDGLGDGGECCLDCQNTNLVASSIKACPDPCREGKNDDIHFEWQDIVEEGVNVTDTGILTPTVSVF